MATTYAHPRRTISARIVGLIASMVVGAVFIVISLPKGTGSLARRDGWNWLSKPAEYSSWFGNILPNMSDLLTWINYALLGYFAALFLMTLRHGRLGLFLRGLGVSVLAVSVLHLLAWIGLIVFYVGKFIVWLFGTVFGFLGGIARDIAHFVIDLIIDVFGPIFGGLGWAPGVGILAVLMFLAYRFGPEWLKITVIVVLVIAAVAAVLAGLLFLVTLLPAGFWPAVGKVIGWIVAVALAVLVLATVGQLFIDQMRSTALAGRGKTGVTMGAIAIGSTLALLMLVGNVYGAYDLYPPVVAQWAQDFVRSNSAPQFDASVSLAVIGLSAIGVLANLVRMRREPNLKEFRKSLIYTIVGGITAGSLAFVAKQTEH